MLTLSSRGFSRSSLRVRFLAWSLISSIRRRWASSVVSSAQSSSSSPSYTLPTNIHLNVLVTNNIKLIFMGISYHNIWCIYVIMVPSLATTRAILLILLSVFLLFLLLLFHTTAITLCISNRLDLKN